MNERTLIQIICVEWSKSSRGGPLATLRNRVPDALLFEAGDFEAGERVWIEQSFYREPDFSRPRRVVRESHSSEFSLFHLSNLAITHKESATRIAGALQTGARQNGPLFRYIPIRHELQAGQSARLRWNVRNGGLYQQITLNIARVEGDFAPDIFTSRAPDFCFESLAMLR